MARGEVVVFVASPVGDWHQVVECRVPVIEVVGVRVGGLPADVALVVVAFVD